MADRTYNMVESRLYEEDWSQGARLIAGVLLARCPNQYGIYDTPRWFLCQLFDGIFTREQIEGFLDELKNDGFIRFYKDRKIIWIVKKWKREQKNPSKNNFKGASTFLENYCDELVNDFKGVYRGLVGAMEGLDKKGNPLPSTDSDTDSDSDSESEVLKEKRTYELQNSRANFANGYDPELFKELVSRSKHPTEDWLRILKMFESDKKCELYDAYKHGGKIKWLLKENNGQTNTTDNDKMYWYDSIWGRYSNRL